MIIEVYTNLEASGEREKAKQRKRNNM